MTPIEELLKPETDFLKEHALPTDLVIRGLDLPRLLRAYKLKVEDQLKAKHKEDVIKAWSEAFGNYLGNGSELAEQYYKDNHQNKEG